MTKNELCEALRRSHKDALHKALLSMTTSPDLAELHLRLIDHSRMLEVLRTLKAPVADLIQQERLVREAAAGLIEYQIPQRLERARATVAGDTTVSNPKKSGPPARD